jgi:diguanylate cyclase (GGDEF)-like protein
MGPIQPSDLVYLILRLILAAITVGAAVNAAHYARHGRTSHRRHLLLARVGAVLLGIAATMSTVDAVDNAIIRWDEVTPWSSWLWLFCFDMLLPIYAFLLVHAWRQRDRAEAEMARMVVTDLLTGCLNRRGFFERALVAVGQARRAGEMVAVAMLDIDHFKAINDRAGHAAGDAALARIAGAMAAGLRPGDVFGRVGGDEFALILPGCSAEEALHTIERLRARVRTGLADLEVAEPLTISAGVASLAETNDPEPALRAGLDAADDALYAAKQAGRDRVVPAGSALPAPLAAIA